MNARVGAFFDLDGTLLPLPSLEQRFFRKLRYRREIPLLNYFLWCREALRLLPRGIGQVMHANKMYLRGVHNLVESGAGNQTDFHAHKNVHKEEGQVSVLPKHNPRRPFPRFFEEGVEKVAWHATQGHALVILSGTLEPSANAAARILGAELAARGIFTEVRVCATTLEARDGRWTGCILGEAMFGEAKARTIFKLAQEMDLDLSQSWAYGDSAHDRWMLAAVGNPAAVNPTPKLARIARKQGWPILRMTNRAQQIRKPVQRVEQCA